MTTETKPDLLPNKTVFAAFVKLHGNAQVLLGREFGSRETIVLPSEMQLRTTPTEMDRLYLINLGRLSHETLKELEPPTPSPDQVLGDKWRSMKNAPKDRKRFIALHADGYISFAKWNGYDEFVVVNNGDYCDGGHGRNYSTKPHYANSDYEPIVKWRPLPTALEQHLKRV